jgi:RNA-directed DNA polymerase
VFIPKPDGRQRPLGVAALEDKILQRAVVEVLNAVYEQDFLGFSYGFRPGRSPHHALDALAVGIRRERVNWVLDTDFRDYFSSLDHRWLERFLEHRIADKRVLRLIQKWLAAGVIEKGSWTACEEGVPQGASASPLLANVYAHYVFDLWAHQWRRRHARGNVVIVRFADDAVVGFEHRDDAERFSADLRDRLAKFGLELNAEKTRLIRFGRFAVQQRQERGLGKPETFSFLGFTHICAQSRKGRFKLKRITDSKRVPAKLHALKGELRWRRHLPIPERDAGSPASCRGTTTTTQCPTTARRYAPSATRSSGSGNRRYRAAARKLTWPGSGCRASLTGGYLDRTSCIPGPSSDSTPEPKARAQCVRRARWDLRGGQPEPEHGEGLSLPRPTISPASISRGC